MTELVTKYQKNAEFCNFLRKSREQLWETYKKTYDHNFTILR